MMRLIPLPASQDNDLWFCGARPVLEALQREGLELEAILVKHHHPAREEIGGRQFEGTPMQMRQSVEKLASVPGETRGCRTHEHTLSNLKLALAVEPANLQLINYGKPGTMPPPDDVSKNGFR
jgi:hypothetical protein